MVYLAKKDGGVVHHTNLEALKEMDGIEKPDMQIADEEFEAAGCLVRLIDGKIFLGKTESEKTAESNEARIIELKGKLSETDYIAAKIAEGSATVTEYKAKIADRQSWREEIRMLDKN